MTWSGILVNTGFPLFIAALSAFTIFAKKVGRERRIPFESCHIGPFSFAIY